MPVAREPSERRPLRPIPQSSDSEPPPSELGEEVDDEEFLHKAICDNNWRGAKAFLKEHRSAVSAKITSSGKTALHVAAMFGHVSIVEDLVDLMPPEDLKNVDDFGITPLLIATVTGVTRVAECMVNKNRDIVGIATPACELPVTLAFLHGHQQMGRYLYSVTPLECLTQGTQGPKLLRCCLQTQCLDIVVDVLQKCEELLFACDKEGWRPIVGIATMSSAFLGGSELVFWKRWIYSNIKIQSTTKTKDVCIDIEQGEHKRVQGKLMVPGMREICELKLMHAQAAQILRLVCKTVRKSKELSVFAEALVGAAKEGNVEFVVLVSKAHPEIVLIGDTSIPNIFYYAVQFRQARVFNLIHGLRFKDALTTNRDDSGNSLLHVVATLAPPSHLNSIYGAALQMQRELQWFKEVESVIPATIRVAQNNEGMTPKELFRESHKELMKEGEKWIKETASSCSVVGALVVTIMFAAAFTVPGGNNQEFGYPIFIKENFFTLFIFSTILSLLSSSTSVLMFLGILTSRYSEEDFLKSLPTKLIIGLSALFISIATMIIAFLATIGLMLQHSDYSWGLLPVVILASIPVSLFVLLQFPLLFNTIFSTYAGIFNRKVELWP